GPHAGLSSHGEEAGQASDAVLALMWHALQRAGAGTPAGGRSLYICGADFSPQPSLSPAPDGMPAMYSTRGKLPAPLRRGTASRAASPAGAWNQSPRFGPVHPDESRAAR